MTELKCMGLPADWLNGWLAAIGCTVLVPGLRLSWSSDPVPLAILTMSGCDDIVSAVQQSLPAADGIAELPISRNLAAANPIGFELTLAQFGERARIARSSPYAWTLSSLYTDVRWDDKDGPKIDKAPFLTPMPKGGSMFDRIERLVAAIEPEGVAASFDGAGHRVQQYGIGFDVGRIGSLADKTEMYVDPVIDLLAFFGLSLFPVRGNGRSTNQRGWRTTKTRVGDFRWAAWAAKLTAPGVDAILDRLYRSPSAGWDFIASWELVPYQARGSEATRGFGSRRVV